MRGLINRFSRSFSEDISNTFRSRTKLFEFYKHTHPDVLSHAPERIKEENLRSLKILNSYLDNLSQNQGVSEQRVKFYIADKATKKSKKYYFFDVTLGSLKENVPVNILSKHLDNCVNSLLNNLKTTKIQTDPKLKEQYEKDDGKNSYSFEDMQYTMKPIRKDSTLFEDRSRDFFETHLTNAMLFQSVHRHKLRSLMDNINDQLFYLDKESVKPALWSKIIYDSDIYQKQIFQIFSSLLDPRMIFLDNSLTLEEIKKFQTAIIPNEPSLLLKKKFKNLSKVFFDMENSSPQIFLYVSREYSSTKVPGYLTIPFNFKTEELVSFYEENKDDILDGRQNYKELLERIDKAKEILCKKANLKKITIPETSNQDELNSTMIVLKQLMKLLITLEEEEQSKLLSNLKEPIEFLEINKKGKLDLKQKYLTIPLQISENELRSILF